MVTNHRRGEAGREQEQQILYAGSAYTVGIFSLCNSDWYVYQYNSSSRAWLLHSGELALSHPFAGIKLDI